MSLLLHTIGLGGKIYKTMENEMDEIGIKRKEDGTFDVGTIGGPGRPKDTPETIIIKKATKELIAEYKESLGEALPLIRPVIIAKALEGDIAAIKEIHDRVMDKSKQPTDITSGGDKLQFNIINYSENNNNPVELSAEELPVSVPESTPEV